MALTDKSSIVIPKGFYGKANVLQGFNPQTENLVDLDVVRNTTATRVNEQGLIESVPANVPRRDFLNGGCGELLVEPQRTNLFLNSQTGTTQTINVTSGNTYSVSFSGTGSITFSGGATGTLNGTGPNPTDRVDVQITPSTNSVTCTISGTVEYVNFETGKYASSWIETLNSAVTRNKDLTAIDLSTEGVDEQYAVLFNVQADGGRLLMKSAGAGIDLDIKNSGKFAMLVDLNIITFKFPDNGQPQTELVYEKPADFRDIEFEAKLGPVRIEEVIWTEQLQPAEYNAWISGTVSSDFLETDWGSETDFNSKFRDEDWDYFPVIDPSSGVDFRNAWRNNQLTSFPKLDLSLGTNFGGAWNNNQLTSFPQLDVSSGVDFRAAWRDNQLTSFPANMFDNLTNPLTSCFVFTWDGNSIDAQGVENILVSIDTSGANAPSSGVDIDISSNGDALTAATNSAITSLKGKGWNIVIDGVAQ